MKFVDLFVPSGIGDIYWVLMKLARKANEIGAKFRIHVPPGQDVKMQRGKFLEFIDCVESVEADGIPYKDLIVKAGQEGHYEELKPVMYCECNTWLEEGNRIEFYLPAFETEYVLNWQFGVDSLRRAKSFLKSDKKNIVVYTSGKQNNASVSTGRWRAADWLPRIEKLKENKDVNLVWIGASYDVDILEAVPGLRKNFDRILIDESSDVIIQLLRLCDGFISYQSGLSVISVVEKIPTYMLYFRKIDKLRYSFNPPDGVYDAPFFDWLPDFDGWVESLPLRPVLGREVKQKDYTFWVDKNLEVTEKDWLENPVLHDEQYETIKDLEGLTMEIGCGSGCLAQRIQNNYLGVDQSKELLKLAQNKNPNKVFVFGDIRNLPLHFKAENVCAFGFMKHFKISEWDFIFAVLAGRAEKTLTIETPLSETGQDWEEVGYEFPHTFVTDERVRQNAEANGFSVDWVKKNSANEFTYRMTRK